MLNYWLYDQIYNKIRYFKSEKSGITKSIHHNFARIGINSYNSLRTEKILSFHNVIILIKFIYSSMFVYYKCYISIELKFLNEFMLIRQANQKSAISVTIGTF